MKTRNCFLLLTLLFVLFATFEAADTCPSGMRKLYIDDTNTDAYGSGYSPYGAICFYDDPGSLFLKRKILIEPRFEVHLKVSINPVDVIENAREKRIYGFTIVISSNNNTISGMSNRIYKLNEDLDQKIYSDIGYNNFRNSLIVEFDFFKDSNDPDTSSYSLRFCTNTCNSDDNSYLVFGKGRLNSQTYDANKVMNWDFRLIYIDKVLSLYSGQNEMIYSGRYDLVSKLGTNIAYVGFTGFLEGNNRELSLLGTFVCEDNYDLPKMYGDFYINSKAVREATFTPGAAITFKYSFINNKNQVIPHTFGYNIWSYNFSVVSDCGESSADIHKLSDTELIVTTKACSNTGRHAIFLSEKLKGTGPSIYYTITAGQLKTIKLIGHDGIIATVPTKNIGGYKYFNYGDSPKGDFIMKKNAKLVLDFDFLDQYGNSLTVEQPASYFSFRKVYDNGDIFPVTDKILTFTVSKKDKHYQMYITVLQMGTYRLDKKTYTESEYRFTVVPGEVDPTVSWCTLNGSPAIESGSRLFVADCTGGLEQKWSYNADGSITNFSGDLCADVPSCTKGDEQIIIYACHLQNKQACEQSQNQAWDFKNGGAIITRQTGHKCLDVLNNRIVRTAACNGGATQKFYYDKETSTITNGNKCFSPFDLLDDYYKTITSPPTLSLGENVYYMCYLKDAYGNEVTTKYFLENSIYDFKCETQRTSPSVKTYGTTLTDKKTYLINKYVTVETGKFEINGYFVKKGTTNRSKITPKINQFTVKGDANGYTMKNVLNLPNRNWVSLDLNNPTINYLYDQTGLLTVIDFAEADGKTLISSYGRYPNDFKVSDCRAVLYNSHDLNYKFGDLEARMITIDNKQYVGIYTKDKSATDKLVKKSSFDYTIQLKYINEQKYVQLHYNLNIGSYKTCFHDLDISKTNVISDETLEFLPDEPEKKFAKLELSTIDSYLYNYDIGKENIELLLDNGSKNITFRVVPLSIEGTYDLYGKAVGDYQGYLYIKVKGQEVKRIPINAKREACYLEFKHPELFTYLGTDFKEHYYRYIGPFYNGSFEFLFKILDKNRKEIKQEDYFSTYADIYSHQYGNDITKFFVWFNHSEDMFDFRDNLPYADEELTWVFFMREHTCNNKYYINYDGLKGGPPLALNNSYYSLLKNQINVQEYGYVDVIYKDIIDRLYGLQDGKLEEMKKFTEVRGKSADGKEIIFEFDTITKNHAIRYKYKFNNPGKYTVTATALGETLTCSTSKILTVVDNIYSLKHSKLQAILDTIIDMDPNVRVTINNISQRPVYKLYFYSATGVKTTCPENSVFKCKMTGNKCSLDLNVEKKGDHVVFTHKDEDMETFRALVKGDYKLIVSDNKEEVEYPLYLLGDGSTDASNDPIIDYDKIEVNPTVIRGIVGNTYTIDVEFRAADGFRWNHLVDVNKFSFKNSYNLNSTDLSIKVEPGYKNGQARILVNQKKVSTDNKLTLTYDGKEIPKKVTLIMECGELAELRYVSGPTVGNVITPPILTFQPVDSFGNVYTPLFTSPQTQKYLNSLTVGKSLDGAPLTSNNYLDPEKQTLKVQYKSTVAQNVRVTSQYFPEHYDYRIRSGPIDPETSYAELLNSETQEVIANYNLMIYPKDLYLNDIDDLNTTDMNNFYTYYQNANNKNDKKYDVKDCELRKEGVVLRMLGTDGPVYKSIECESSVNKTGDMEFHVDYLEDEILCRNCKFTVTASGPLFKNTKTYYTNRKYYLNTEKQNEVEAKVNPTFELTFFDKYGNQIGAPIVQKMNLTAEFGGSDIKLCMANSNEKKIITVCPSTNGDDNLNKWQYLVNGDHYKLMVEEVGKEKNRLSYNLTIKGGYPNGSSEEPYISNTVFIPDKIVVQAGEEGKTIMEIRTGNDERKNYWYPNPAEKIKVEFAEDKDTCSYTVETADEPGRYAIKIVCTKANDNNKFSVTVDGQKVPKTVGVIVEPGPAYYLEVEDPSKFTVSSDKYKYTWKVNPTNDDQVSFKFKLLDKYMNYITESVIGKNQITIGSETFGDNGKYYDLKFDSSLEDYLFTDKIDTYVEKHTWNIVCLASGKKYSFIYNRLPGKVDLDKSYWEIDKTEYIVEETSTVLVTLLDRLGVNVGIVKGNLEKEEKNVVVNISNGKTYAFNSITNDNKLKYLYQYTKVGNYDVSVKYSGKQLKEKKAVTVSYEKVDLNKSKLYYDLGDHIETLMLTTKKTVFNNKVEYPFYKFYLYDKNGKNVTHYDHSTKVTCKMSYGSTVWLVNVDMKDNHIVFAYPDGFQDTFKRLPLGDYYLNITFGGQKIDYPLYLNGDADVSVIPNFDPTNILIRPTHIDGIAGQQYEVFVEFRCKDDLRWNYEIIPDSFRISNSYKLNATQLKIVRKKGEKNGQLTLLITQYVTTTGKKDNILSFTYQNQKINQTVSLNIKCADFKYLEYHSGAVDGTVVNPSIVKFIPRDLYGNVYTDLFDEKLYPKEKLAKLTQGVSVEGHPLTTNNYVDGQFLNVQYGSKKVTTIKLTSPYNPNEYKYKLWSGPMYAPTSFAQIEKTNKVRAGDKTTLDIYPKDIYENNVTNVTDKDLTLLEVAYEVNNGAKNDITKTCSIVRVDVGRDFFKCNEKITKAGEIEFTVDYTSEDVECRNCKFRISPDVIDFEKTKVFNKNENKEMSRTELNVLPASVNPLWEMFFFDQYLNPIEDSEEVKALDVKTKFVESDIKLCVKNNNLTKLSNPCPSTNNDENDKKWQYLPNGKDYKLLVSDPKTTLPYPVEIVNGYTGGDPGPIDVNKTSLNPREITLVAGEKGKVQLELRTSDDNRKNYWFDEPEKHISVKFPEDVKKCKYSLEKAENPGQYSIIFECTEKKDPFNATVSIDNKPVPEPVTITVVPNALAYSKLFRMTGEEITKPDLGSVSVEDKFQMKNLLYDKYDNLITDINFDLSILKIRMNPVNEVIGHKWSAEPAEGKNGEIIITLRSTFAGEHVVQGAYFPLEKYNILFTPGRPDADNSLLEVSHTERYAGEEAKIYITPYDKYNNYIDAMKYKVDNPYEANYTNEGNATRYLLSNYSVEKRGGLNVLSYPEKFYVKGIASIFGYITKKPIKCVTCRINIKTNETDFLKSYVDRLDPIKNKFELLKNGTIENNTRDEPVYRLYPRDQYENSIDVIPEKVLKSYKAYFKSQNESTVYNLKLNNKETKDQKYAEFVINDVEGEQVTYKTLVGGLYDLVFTDGDKKLVYNVTLTGDGKGGSNEDADPQKTVILEQNLKYVAGYTGYMLLEIRTSQDVRKNYWDGFNFSVKSCDEKDKTFNYTQERAGSMGVFLITVTTQKANTFPKLKQCKLKLYLNDELLTHLNPEQEVSPDEIVRTVILPKYYKDGKNSSVLKDGNADEDYVFEVASYDQYDNFAETLQEVVDLRVKYEGHDEVKKTTSETDYESGYRKYVVPARKAGTYVISTDKVGKKGLYLQPESIFVIHPGAIDLSKTIVKEKETPIKAGSKPAVSIDAFDRHGNALYPEDYINNFTATFIDPVKKKHNSKGENNKNIKKVFYTSVDPVTVVGFVKVDVVYNKKDPVDASNVLIEVIPGDPDPKNSILSRETEKGKFAMYKNGDSFEVKVKDLLILNVTLYDAYMNRITNIPSDAKILDPTMSGNKMSEINFTVTRLTDYFNLDFNDKPDYIHTYQHLVNGTYDLTYKVKTVLGEAPFKYNIIIKDGDGKHGNGPYEKITLTPEHVTFTAGTYGIFTLELRTAEGLLYNDDIDIEKDTDLKIVKDDKTFLYSIEKADPNVYGVYTIKVYSEVKGDNSFHVFLKDLKKENEKIKVGPGKYTVVPEKVPDKRYTVFYTEPEEEVDYDSLIEMTFTLADRFNNTFEGRNDIVDDNLLTLINNGEPIQFNSLTLLPDGKTYNLTVYPKFPPRIMRMNTIYNDGNDTVDCFLNDTVVKIRVGIDYNQTQIVSKNKNKIRVGEILDMWLYTFDKVGECIDDKDYSDDYEIVVTGPLDSDKKFVKKYKVKHVEENDLECNNEYQIITTDDDKYKYTGNYLIEVYGGGNKIATYDQVCTAGDYSLNGFLLDYSTFDPNNINILDKVKFTITGTDDYGNVVNDSLIDDIVVYFTQDDDNTEYDSKKRELTQGVLDYYDVSIHKIGPHQMHMTYKGKEVETVNHGEKLPIFNIKHGPCRADNNDNFDLSTLSDFHVNAKNRFSFRCFDQFGNQITEGGEHFTVNAQRNDKGVLVDVEAEVIDNGDGTYTVQFIPELQGLYLFNLFVDNEKYGEEIQVNLKNNMCEGDTPISCPNMRKCVADRLDCVQPPDKCKEDKNKPFYCKVNGTYTCTRSQIDCDCPSGYIRCAIQKYCVPENRSDMCATVRSNDNYCKINYGSQYKMFKDGYCRRNDYRMPNQRVCPIGQVLCADLTCRNNYDECVVSDLRTGGQVRCVGQQLVSDVALCPNTITCARESDVVCPNGKCVDSELYCDPLPSLCNDEEKPYHCQNDMCATDYRSCSDGIACGHQWSLCEDQICRETC